MAFNITFKPLTYDEENNFYNIFKNYNKYVKSLINDLDNANDVVFCKVNTVLAKKHNEALSHL